MKHVLGKNSRSTLSNVQSGDSQPNAVDLRLGKIFKVSSSLFRLSEEEKVHRGSFEIQPDVEGWWNLPEGHYEVVMENVINVGPNEAGWVITRSTLNRNGIFLTSGLYDTGYNGVMAGMMHITCGAFRVRKGTRIGQYLSFEAESLSEYKGSYGLNSGHDAKYVGSGNGGGGTNIPEEGEQKIDFRKIDISIEELAAMPKQSLNWYQRKRVNQFLKDQKKKLQDQAKAREEATRAELAAREKDQKNAARRDAVQVTTTHIVSKG